MLVLGSGACSSGKKQSSAASTTQPTTGANSQFCQAAQQLAASRFTYSDGAGRTRIIDALNQLATTAPPSFQSTAASFRTLVEQLFAYFDQVIAAGRTQNSTQIQQLGQQGQQLGSQVGALQRQVSTVVSQNCPGVTIPTAPAAPPG